MFASDLLHRVPGLPPRVADLPGVASALVRSGVIAPVRPDRAAGMLAALAKHGASVAGAYEVGRARHPDRVAVIDDAGSLTFAEMADRAAALAAGLADLGVREGDQVGVLLRNSRYLLLTLNALSQLGADALLLNTGFAGPQATEVMQRHDARAVVHDGEFRSLFEQAGAGRIRVVGCPEGETDDDEVDIDALVRRHTGAAARRSARESKLVVLTSGTTGAPKGAERGASGATGGLNLLHVIPLKAAGTTLIACPAFHSWGLAHTALGLALGSTLVLQRRFDPERALVAIAEHRVDTLVVVPVMLQRMVDLPAEIRERYDTSSLRVAATSGAPLPGELALRFMDAFGDVIYNLYGSTEVGTVTVAAPRDLREAPGTAGRIIPGTRVEVLGDDDHRRPPGKVGRIFAGSSLSFTGYTGGGDKQRVRGLVSSGDMGYFDERGRLFVTGRDDDMIVSGGENVFPAEVEDLLTSQPEVEEAAVVGVPDEKFGQRLAAYVVLRDGTHLTGDDVRGRVKQHLAGYKVPRDVVFLDALPRNETGKVVKRELAPSAE